MYDISELSHVMEYHDFVIRFCNKVLAFGSDKVYTWHGVRLSTQDSLELRELSSSLIQI